MKKRSALFLLSVLLLGTTLFNMIGCEAPVSMAAKDSLVSKAVLGEWTIGVSYKVGDVVTYQGIQYTCQIANTAIATWEPPNVPALWVPGGSVTNTPTPTPTPTPTTTPSTSVSPTATPTPTPVSTATPTPTPTPSATATPVPTATPTPVSGATPWTIGVAYKIGDLVTYNGHLYQCQIANTAQAGWEPSNVPALWVDKGTVSTTPTPTPTPTPTITPTPTPTPTGSTPTPTPTPTPTTTIIGNLPSKLLVGYWHNFDNGTGFIRLRNVIAAYDVINVAFVDIGGDRATATFTPYQITPADFKSDVDFLHSKGKKVVISVGGQNGALTLGDATTKQAFITSMTGLINQYGFDGIDLDVETGVAVGPGDADIKNPQTPAIVNLISATRTICNTFGSNFILSMAPEIAYVQGGITAFGGPWGGYLPIIEGLRDKLTYLHVQHYNAGGNAALDGVSYSQGTSDFEVAMAEMLTQGFPIAGNAANRFAPLREDQVMIGLPATGPAAPSGGYIAPANMIKALNAIIKGVSYGGAYHMVKASGYPGFRGLMTWSVNWDAVSSFEFSNAYRPYFNALLP